MTSETPVAKKGFPASSSGRGGWIPSAEAYPFEALLLQLFPENVSIQIRAQPLCLWIRDPQGGIGQEPLPRSWEELLQFATIGHVEQHGRNFALILVADQLDVVEELVVAFRCVDEQKPVPRFQEQLLLHRRAGHRYFLATAALTSAPKSLVSLTRPSPS